MRVSIDLSSPAFVSMWCVCALLGPAKVRAAPQPCEGAPFPGALQVVSGYADMVRAVDLNADSRADLIAASSRYAQFEVLLQQPNGSFAPPQTYTIDDPVQTLAVGDMSGDARADVVMLVGSSVEIFASGSDGTLSLTEQFVVGGEPEGVQLADVDADGDLDVVCLRRADPSLYVMTNDGQGQLTHASSVPLPATVTSFLLLDVDLNATPDAVIAHSSGGAVLVSLNDGGGHFAEPVVGFSHPGFPNTLRQFVAADLDADGDPDLAWFYGNGGAALLENAGDATFVLRASLPLSGTIGPVVFADVNSDALAEPFVFRTVSGGYVTRLNLGGWLFGPEVEVPCPVRAVAGTDVADFNDDAVPDIVVLHGGRAGVMFGLEEDGLFDAGLDAIEMPYPIRRAAPGDVNGDGLIDILVGVNQFPGGFYVLLGHGDGTFDDPIYSLTRLYSVTYELEDLNVDGKLDIAMAAATGFRVALGNGDGTFQSATIATPTRLDPYLFKLGHLDDDGMIDAVILSDEREMTFAFGHDDGSFETPLTLYADPSIAELIIGDINNDTIPDVVVCRGGDSTFAHLTTAFLGLGDREFTDEVLLSNDCPARNLLLTDTDSDGDLDLVSATGQTLINLGNGAFVPGDLSVPVITGGIAALSDFDGDGFLDIIGLDDDAHLLRRAGPGRYEPVSLHGFPEEASSIDAVDFDRDGRVDLITAAESTITLLFAAPCSAYCRADLDQSGTLNLDDIVMFADAFVTGHLLADLDENGVLNLDDVAAFAGAFLAGCP